MELDAKGGASFEQLQDLIKKECDKRDKKYHSLEQKYYKLQDSFENSQSQKNLQMRGQRGTSNKMKSPPASRRMVPNQCGWSTTTKRRPQGRQGKADDTNSDITNDNPVKSKWKRGTHDRNRRKGLPPPIRLSLDRNHKQNKTTIWIHCRPK